MDKIEINADNAKAAIEMADDNLKPVLEVLFGVTHSFKTYEDIKTFADACKVVPPPPEHMAIINYQGADSDLIATGAFLQLTHISRAMNFLQNGNKIWEPDWTNSSEYKYYPWLKYVAGSGWLPLRWHVCVCRLAPLLYDRGNGTVCS